MNENMIFSNSFGIVTDKRLIITHKSGSEDVPIKQVTSVSFERNQNRALSVIYFIAALITVLITLNLRAIGSLEILVALILLIFFILAGISHYLGNHSIRFTIAGKEGKAIKVEMSKTKEGKEFYQAVRKQIISI